jgi:VIT1/CCC1 family predicted Fe2+/Mn2+ transporter
MLRCIFSYILGSMVTMLTYLAWMDATYTAVLLSGSMISVTFWWVWSAAKSIKEDLDNDKSF